MNEIGVNDKDIIFSSEESKATARHASIDFSVEGKLFALINIRVERKSSK